VCVCVRARARVFVCVGLLATATVPTVTHKQEEKYSSDRDCPHRDRDCPHSHSFWEHLQSVSRDPPYKATKASICCTKMLFCNKNTLLQQKYGPPCTSPKISRRRIIKVRTIKKYVQNKVRTIRVRTMGSTPPWNATKGCNQTASRRADQLMRARDDPTVWVSGCLGVWLCVCVCVCDESTSIRDDPTVQQSNSPSDIVL
jgi:hypothetical protein